MVHLHTASHVHSARSVSFCVSIGEIISTISDRRSSESICALTYCGGGYACAHKRWFPLWMVCVCVLFKRWCSLDDPSMWDRYFKTKTLSMTPSLHRGCVSFAQYWCPTVPICLSFVCNLSFIGIYTLMYCTTIGANNRHEEASMMKQTDGKKIR